MVTISPNQKTASYQDALGDTFFVKTTAGKFTSSQFTFDANTQGQLTELDLSGQKGFTGAAISFSVIPVANGTGVTNIGYINATGINLGSVTVPGDLGRIDVGGGATPLALGKLTINSLGAQGTNTQGTLPSGVTASVISNITGTLGTLNVTGDIDGGLQALDYKSKPTTGNINVLNVGGSINGNASDEIGEIFFTGRLGSAVIHGGIEGGSNSESGSIRGYYGEFASIGSIQVLGSVPDDPNPSPIPGMPGTSILGGAGGLSGGISAAKVGSVFVAGDVFGSSGGASGFIQGGSKLGSVTIKGSLIGGNFVSGTPSGANSAGVVFGGSIGSVFIGQSIIGGSGINSGEVLSTGAINKIVVMGDVAGGSAGQSSTGGFAGIIQGNKLGSVTVAGSVIGGNLVGGDANQLGTDGGVIVGTAGIGSISIAKNVSGGTGSGSGSIEAPNGTVGTLKIGGGLIGGAGTSSGEITIAGASKMVIAGNIAGGTGANSGNIAVNGGVGSLSIGGSLTGGAADTTGTISVFGLLKSATIVGSITGSNSGATMLTNTGYVQANGIGTMVVGGSLTSGTAGSGGLDTSGAIRSTLAIRSLTIGSLVGNATNPAIISAPGQARLTGTATSDVAINTVKILHNSTYGDILAGYSTDTQNGTEPLGTGVNADAQIGTVMIGGDMSATNIIAGVGPGTSGFGTSTSAALSGVGVADLPAIISKISKVVVSGSVVPTSIGTDSFGIAAQYIVSASVAGVKLPLTPGPDNDTFALGKQQPLPSSGGDEFLYEV